MFTLSVLVTWVPASINRIRSLRGGEVPFSYHVAIVTVMPLQGLWNAIIFFTMSRSVVRQVAREKWGLWVLKSTTIDGEVLEREAGRGANVHGYLEATDPGSEVEVSRLSR